MNPLFIGLEKKVKKDTWASRDERVVQEDMARSLPSVSLALRLGRLLIRMGSKLAHEDTFPTSNQSLN